MTEEYFKEEAAAHKAVTEAVEELGRLCDYLQTQSDLFDRKSGVILMAWKMGIPKRLYRALERFLYGDKKERAFAAKLIGAWCRGQK